MEQRARFQCILLVEEHADARLKIVLFDGGQETDAPGVDTHQRDAEVADQIGGVDERTVTSDGNHKVHCTKLL